MTGISVNVPATSEALFNVAENIQLFRERLSEKMCTRQPRKVIWDMINTLFQITVAVDPTFVAFHEHSRTYVHGLSSYSSKFLWRTRQTKPPTIAFGIVACTFSDNLSRNSCMSKDVLTTFEHLRSYLKGNNFGVL